MRLAKAHGTIKSVALLRAARGHLLLNPAFVLTELWLAAVGAADCLTADRRKPVESGTWCIGLRCSAHMACVY